MQMMVPFLMFNGNCREAMEFYRYCLGGDLSFQTLEESPVSGELPDRIKKYIVRGVLTQTHQLMIGTDLVTEPLLQRGNDVAFSLQFHSINEMTAVYTKLSELSKSNRPMESTYWGGLVANVVDRYGYQWILHFNKLNK